MSKNSSIPLSLQMASLQLQMMPVRFWIEFPLAASLSVPVWGLRRLKKQLGKADKKILKKAKD